MVIALAHEIFHLLTGFLLGQTEEPHTPPGISLPEFRVDEIGEAGRYWEKLLLGGLSESGLLRNIH